MQQRADQRSCTLSCAALVHGTSESFMKVEVGIRQHAGRARTAARCATALYLGAPSMREVREGGGRATRENEFFAKVFLLALK